MKRIKKAISKTTLTGLLAASSALSLLPATPIQAQDTFEGYWSETNTPLIYGATKITMPTGAVADFDPEDPRFRAFAKDFEDGDLTQAMTVSGTVDPDTPGTYELEYTVTDSHHNTVTLDVPVIVSDDETEFTVERTLYNLPSWANLNKSGLVKGYNGDRQMIGVYVPANKSIQMRVLDSSGLNLFYSAVTNDRAKENKEYMELPANGSTVTLTGSNRAGNGADFASVPAVFARFDPKHDKGQMSDRSYINHTNLIEVKFGTDIPALDYYHYGDDEQAFRAKWHQSQNEYGVIESGRVMAFVPYADLDQLTNSAPMSESQTHFPTLDAWMDWEEAMMDRFDGMLGLEYKTNAIAHQNVPYKQVFRANASGAGAAYHQGSHIGNTGTSILPLFRASWMSMHEMAHGYQGKMDTGNDLWLGETSNNFLAHYSQLDRSFFPYEAKSWLYGSENETQKAQRVGINHLNQAFNSYGHGDRLYIFVNLFDSLRGIDTYRDAYRLFREELQKGNVLSNADAFALAIAKYDHVNILPYFASFMVNVSDDVKTAIMDMELPVLAAAEEILPDSMGEFIQNEGVATTARLLSGETLRRSGKTGNLTLSLEESYAQKHAGKEVLVKDGKEIIRSVPIRVDAMEIQDLPAGRYVLEFPAESGIPERSIVTVQEGENKTYDQDFEEVEFDTSEHVMGTGYRETLQTWNNGKVWEVMFDNDYGDAKILSGPGTVEAGKTARMTIYANDGTEKWTEADGAQTLSMSYGDRIRLDLFGYNVRATVKQSFTDAFPDSGEINEKKAGGWKQTYDNTVWYIVTPWGLVKSSDGDVSEDALQETKDIRSSALLKQYGNRLNNYLNTLPDDRDAILALPMRQQLQLKQAGKMLEEKDRPQKLKDVLGVLDAGHAPVIKYAGPTEIIDGNKPDILAFLEAADKEDGIIQPDHTNTVIEWNGNTATVRVTDTQGNEGILEITFTEVETEAPQITYTGPTEIVDGVKPDILSHLTVTDKEDGVIQTNESNTQIVWNGDEAVVTVTDSHGKTGSLTIQFTERETGSPQITYTGPTVIVNGVKPDLLNHLHITDQEDGIILPTDQNTIIVWNGNEAAVTVTDSDGKTGTLTIVFTETTSTAPVVSYNGPTEIVDGNVPDILAYLTITDLEDGIIVATDANTGIAWEQIDDKVYADVTVTDSEGLQGTLRIEFQVVTTPQITVQLQYDGPVTIEAGTEPDLLPYLSEANGLVLDENNTRTDWFHDDANGKSTALVTFTAPDNSKHTLSLEFVHSQPEPNRLPEITYTGPLTIVDGKKPDILSYLTVTDHEDGIIVPDADNPTIEWNGNTCTIMVTDKDGGTSRLVLQFSEVHTPAVDLPEETKPETKPENKPEQTKPETKPENKPEQTKPETKPENKPEQTKPENKPENKPEQTKPETKPENKPAAPAEAEEEEAPASKPDQSQPAQNKPVQSQPSASQPAASAPAYGGSYTRQPNSSASKTEEKAETKEIKLSQTPQKSSAQEELGTQAEPAVFVPPPETAPMSNMPAPGLLAAFGAWVAELFRKNKSK